MNYIKLSLPFLILLAFSMIQCDSATSAVSTQKELNITPPDTSNSMPPQQELKVMPLGDSITEAFGYRLKLWTKLSENNYNINYVGSQSDPHPNMPDTDHEGHGGWKIAQLKKNVNEWLQTYQPDVVLLMIGTNDLAWWTPKNGTETAKAHAELVDQILANSPSDTWVLAASIPPQSSKVIEPNKVNRQELVKEFNAEMEKAINERNNSGKQVKFVDMNSQLTVDQLKDGIHPTDEGYEQIANTWFGAMNQLIQ